MSKILPTKNSFELVSNKKLSKKVEILDSEHVEELVNNVKDFDKRTFLKVLGVASLGLAATSLFPKKADALIIGNQSTSGSVGVKDHLGNPIDPAKENGNLATIAGKDFATQTTLATLTGKDFATQTTLATVATNTNPLSNLQFDSGSLKVTGGSGGSSASVVGLKDTNDNTLNPASDDAIVYLRRMVKLMESQATVDLANRQRITLDAIGIGTPTAIGTSIPVSQATASNLNATVTLTTGTASIGYLATGSNTIGNVTVGSYDQRQFIDIARNTYANGIRQNLVWN